MSGVHWVEGGREAWGALRLGERWVGVAVVHAVALSPGPAGHVAAVLASLLVLLALLLAALLYVKCRLSVLRWYQDACGEVEMNGAWGRGGRGG